jgi:hypothetical protein
VLGRGFWAQACRLSASWRRRRSPECGPGLVRDH